VNRTELIDPDHVVRSRLWNHWSNQRESLSGARSPQQVPGGRGLVVQDQAFGSCWSASTWSLYDDWEAYTICFISPRSRRC